VNDDVILLQDDSDDQEPRRRPRIPPAGQLAGAILLVFGVLAVLSGFADIALTAYNQANVKDARPPTPGSSCCSFLMGALFIWLGIQTAWGRFRDILGTAITSLLIGLFYLTLGVVFGYVVFTTDLNRPGGNPAVVRFQAVAGVVFVVAMFVAVMLLTASGLAFAGRSRQREWWDEYVRPERERLRRRRRRRYDDEDDWDDRPRRRRADEDRPRDELD
jgi:hypothetical protein